jgi:hypothetical protein
VFFSATAARQNGQCLGLYIYVEKKMVGSNPDVSRLMFIIIDGFRAEHILAKLFPRQSLILGEVWNILVALLKESCT